MNFFDSQDRALRKTRYLLLLMTLAVGVIVLSVTIVIAGTIWVSGRTSADYGSFIWWLTANTQMLGLIALGITAFIGIASIYRVITLSQGGGRVARDLGGRPVNIYDNDPLSRRLHNIVEEMALASGVPVPEVFVMEQEAGINAFAAGFRPEDAAVAVTRGALETLNREELQGVIAHEFSHILNGDMRLNIRLMGPLFGILAIGLLGRTLLRSSRGSSSRNKSSGATVMLGAGLMITGYTGLLIGRLIKAGVSRQREYLADASAVQFTRQTRGIANALKKIGGLYEGSVIEDSEAEEVSHMLFANGLVSFSDALATHPPLFKRIKALDPQFSEADMADLHTERTEIEQADEAAPGVSQFAHSTGSTGPSPSAKNIVDSVGRPDDSHVSAAHAFLGDIPQHIRESLQSAGQASLIPLAMMLNPDHNIRTKQLNLLTQQLGQDRVTKVETLHTGLKNFGYESRLPLMEIALPVIKRQPEGRIDYLAELLDQLALSDNRIEVFEYGLLRIFQQYMQLAFKPEARPRRKHLSGSERKKSLDTLLKMLSGELPAESDDWVTQADAAIDSLRHTPPQIRKMIVHSLLVAALDDGLQQPKAELLRVICLLIDCPLPPILKTNLRG